MNADPKTESADPRDRLVDAMLAEHARLGTAADEGLLATVRALTTENPGPVKKVIPAEATFGFRDWTKVAAVVTAMLGLLWVVFPRGPVFDAPRKEHVFNLVVIPHSPDQAEFIEESMLAGHEKQPGIIPGADMLTRLIPGPDFPPNSLHSGMSFDQFDLSETELSAELLAEFSVSAERILRPGTRGTLVYEGDVVLKHPEFTLKADRLELAAAASGETTSDHQRSVGAFIASGDRIEIDRLSASGAHENALARQVTYQADGGTLILEGGPPSLQTGASYVVPRSAAGMIILRHDGFQVIEPADPEFPLDES